jgi:simple sugar transport system ATP-binding protein
MAAPHVTGALAVIRGLDPTHNVQDAIDIVYGGVDFKPDLTRTTITGGRLNLQNSLNLLSFGQIRGQIWNDVDGDGVFDDLSVRENIALVVQRTLSSLGLVSRAAHARIAERFVRQLDIATPDLERPVKYLSGGNQQKVILARWLAGNPALLILDEPTRGIDVGAKAEIEKLIEQLARRGMAIVFISTELEEVVRRSQRVAVLRDRRKVAELTGDDINEARIMTIIAGDAAADDSPAEGKLT